MNKKQITIKDVSKTWLPLAASWMLMGAELPLLSAIVARLANPEIHLAAYGGVVFPLALIIESPVIMLLAASTALSKDWASYRKLRRYMMTISIVETLIHILIAFTPLYYIVVENIIGAPAVIVEPARIGLMIMTPWTWSIAYRRFNQGTLIRFGHSDAVWFGTFIRLMADAIVLFIGYTTQWFPGIVVATSAVIAGVISEATYIGFRVKPVLKDQVLAAPVIKPPINLRSFLSFYIPLALTSLLTLIVQPIGSAAISRMPMALESLATWPVVSGLVFLLRSLGVAYNEVVVAFLDQEGSYPSLRKFTAYLCTGVTILLLFVVATPLSHIWFSVVSGLSPNLAQLAQNSLWFALPLPALNALQSWYQGAILHSKKTRGIPEAVIVFLVTISGVFATGIALQQYAGIYFALIGYGLGMATQTFWLWYRSRKPIQEVRERDCSQSARSFSA